MTYSGDRPCPEDAPQSNGKREKPLSPEEISRLQMRLGTSLFRYSLLNANTTKNSRSEVLFTSVNRVFRRFGRSVARMLGNKTNSHS